MDWKAIVKALGDDMSDRLQYLVDGAEEDIQEYGMAIAESMIIAVRSGRKDLQDELGDQLSLLAETYRVTLSREVEVMLIGAAKTAVNIGLAMIGGR